MKYLTYWLTFLAYMSLQAMRMSYSYSKPSFQKHFYLSNVFMGTLDAVLYCSIGIGLISRFFVNGKSDPLKAYFVFSALCSIMFMALPVMSYLNVGLPPAGEALITPFSTKAAIIVVMCLFGFCQLNNWPVLLLLVNDYFNAERESSALSFWGACGDAGNIPGFLLSSVTVSILKLEWLIPMAIFSIISFVFAASVFKLLKFRDPA